MLGLGGCMAYTHFTQPVGTSGVYTGAKGSEVRIDNQSVVLTSTFSSTSAAATQLTIAPPYACSIEQISAVQEGAAGTTTWTITEGSAGTTLATLTVASAGARGDVSTQTTITSAAVAANSVVGIARGTSGTTYAATVTVILSRA